MAAEPTTRLAQLPGFDTAPDVYETPSSLHDDSATTAATSPSSDEDDDGQTSATSDEDSESGGVSRRRLYPERARSRFGGVAAKTKGTDLSDRIDGRRRGYGVKYGEEEEEGLEGRIARLRREVEECRVLAREEAAAEGDDGEGEEGVEALSRVLAGIEVPRKASVGRKRVVFHDASDGRASTDRKREEADAETDAEGEDEDLSSEQTLSKISAFDTRLAALETALGISSLPTHQETGTPAEALPLLPSLALLDSQLATLNTATSLASLEAASSRISKLKSEATSLQQPPPDSSEPSPDLTSLNHLTTLLPTLQSLSPTIPALITRLRSLRTLHSTAASASADLDALEKRQEEMERELKMWRSGLEKVENAVKEADGHNGRDGAMVQGWVTDLEKRVQGLAR